MIGMWSEWVWGVGVDVVVRATLLLGGALLVGWVLGARRPGARHVAWTGTFVLLLALPALVQWGPRVSLPILPSAEISGLVGGVGLADVLATGIDTEAAGAPGSERAESGPSPALSPGPRETMAAGARESAPLSPGNALTPLAVLWAIGLAGALVSLLVGMLRFRAVLAQASPVPAGIANRAAEVARTLGLERPVTVVESAAVPTPVAGGCLKPVVVLPLRADRWAEDRLDVVLTHELIHIRRHDALRQLLGQMALSLYWFHPLSWLASRLASISREQACDEAVLSQGTRPSSYANHLIELSDHGAQPVRMAALPMVHRSQLENRIMSILTPEGRRRSATVTAATLIAFSAFGVTAAVAIPVALDVQPPPAAVPDAAPTSPTSEVALPEAPAPAVLATPIQQTPGCAVGRLSGTFSGSYNGGGRTELSGWLNGDRVIQRYVDGLRLCVRSHGGVLMDEDLTEVRAVGENGWLVLESEDGELRRLIVTEDAGGISNAYTVDGQDRSFDAAAEEWRDHVLAILAAYWEASSIRGEESSLRGEISSMRGHVSSLRGNISSHRGHVSSLKGRISSMRGHVSSLKGQISSHRGRVSSLRGEISSIRGRMSSLRSAARSTDDQETQRRLEDESSRYEAQIDDVLRQIEEYDLTARVSELEAEIDQYDLEGSVAQVQREIDQYDLDGKVAELEAEIRAYDLDGKVAEKEREIEALDADRRAEEIEASVAPRVEALKQLLSRG